MQVGDTVWYRRPEGSSDKLASRWIGPALITAREGATLLHGGSKGRTQYESASQLFETIGRKIMW